VNTSFKSTLLALNALEGRMPKKEDPWVETIECYEINLRTRHRVNMDRPRDEAPEVYDVEILGVADDKCTESVIEDLRQTLMLKYWEQEQKEAFERKFDRGDFEYDAWREKQYAAAADAAEDFGMTKWEDK